MNHDFHKGQNVLYKHIPSEDVAIDNPWLKGTVLLEPKGDYITIVPKYANSATRQVLRHFSAVRYPDTEMKWN